MGRSLKQLIKDIRGLSPQDRRELLARLIRDLEPAENISSEEIDAAWDKEISKRLEEIDSGKVKLIPADEVFARIQSRLDEAT